MNSVELIRIAGLAAYAATGEDIHTVQTFREYYVEGGMVTYIVTTTTGRSLRVILRPSTRKGQLIEGLKKATFFTFTEDGKISLEEN